VLNNGWLCYKNEFRGIQQEKFYENPDNTINISIDDVSVKKQKEKRSKDKEKIQDTKTHYVRNTIVHIEKLKERYCLNACSTGEVLPRIVAFLLLNNNLKNYLLFFVDGEKSLHNAFSWFKCYGILLDWYHLSEKCKMELSLALKTRSFRNDILEKIEQQLWIGKIDKTIEILVASRQKHNGMSWSKDGSVALATISTLYKNNEQKNWQEKSRIEFKFVS